jgi:inner membrane protein
MDPQNEPPLIAMPALRRWSVFIKLAGIGALLLLLHIPLFMTRGVLRDRQRYQAQATEEISGVWGREQRVIGPVLAVPYTYNKGNVAHSKLVNNQWVQVEEPARVEAVAYFLPDELKIESVIEPEIRHRGIYDVVVYATHLKSNGTVRADFAAAAIEADHIDWARARLLFGVSDLHGVRSIAPLRRADGTDAPFDATESVTPGGLALAANPGLSATGNALPFTIETIIQGSGTLRVAPVGKSTTAKLHSSWSSPSFSGAWLPTTRQVSPEGFDAEWTIPPFSRGFPQSWTSRYVAEADMISKINAAGFGVRLGQTVDGYSIVERAQKYGILFFVLVFAVFFLFEVTAALRIHPLQYAMVGAALCLFFLGFLALSEFWATGIAYGIAAGACTMMVALYAWSFLKSGGRTLVVFGGLGATYGYLYFVLKSEDYALIAGTAALFAMLALAMYITRRINWYTVATAPAA